MTAYLDHAATAPVRPPVVEAMLPILGERYGNPTGAHSVGRAARQAIDEAREEVATCLGARPDEIIFTSGGTESDNLAVLGAHGHRAGTVVTSAIEHSAVLGAVEAIGGVQCPVTPEGVVDVDALESLVDADTTVVSVMLVNNETGMIQPLHKVARVLERQAPQALLHSDAVQAGLWVDVARMTQFADLITISGHKLGGPQGVGVLIARKRAKLAARSFGGGQERERRSGSHNVAGIVGLAVALRLAQEQSSSLSLRIGRLRDRLVDGVIAAVPDAFETGVRTGKIAGNAHLCFDGVESEALVVLLDEAGICASAGASCTSGAMEPSHVLTAMGMSRRRAMSSLRLTLGYTTTDADVDVALAAIPVAVSRLRASDMAS